MHVVTTLYVSDFSSVLTHWQQQRLVSNSGPQHAGHGHEVSNTLTLFGWDIIPPWPWREFNLCTLWVMMLS
jgi:hypothetical protein